MNNAIARNGTALVLTLLAGIAGGCAHDQAAMTNVDEYFRNPPKDAIADMQIVDGVRDSGVRAAIVAQHTLYPYHFVSDSDALNELGHRDVTVLATHLRGVASGKINIRRGEEMPASLYDARVASVRKMLQEQEVNADRVQITDGTPGGMSPSVDVLRDMRDMHASRNTQAASEQSGGSTQSDTSSNTTGGQQ